MNKQRMIRAMAAIAVILAVNISAEAQGILQRARQAAGQAVQGATGQQSSGGVVQSAAAAAPQKQPWAVDEGKNGAIQATFADGVLTFKGTGKMADYRIDMHNDARPWAAHAKEITAAVVEEGITYLAQNAFYGCENLTSVSLPAGTLTRIGGGAFFGCQSLASITLPKSLDVFSTGMAPDGKGGDYIVGLFGQCKSLTEIKVEAGSEKFKAVDGILYSYFSTKWRLAAYPAGRKNATFNVPDQTPVVSVGAFANCEALKEVTLPQSCGEIQQGAFRGCTALESITLTQPTGAVSLGGDVFEGVDMTKIKISVPKGILENYTTRGDSEWREWASQITGK